MNGISLLPLIVVAHADDNFSPAFVADESTYLEVLLHSTNCMHSNLCLSVLTHIPLEGTAHRREGQI